MLYVSFGGGGGGGNSSNWKDPFTSLSRSHEKVRGVSLKLIVAMHAEEITWILTFSYFEVTSILLQEIK